MHSLFFFNDTATTEIYSLSLHDALPISLSLQLLAFTRACRGVLQYTPTTSPRHVGCVLKHRVPKAVFFVKVQNHPYLLGQMGHVRDTVLCVNPQSVPAPVVILQGYQLNGRLLQVVWCDGITRCVPKPYVVFSPGEFSGF